MVDPFEPVVHADPAVVAGLDHWRTLPIKQQPTWPDPAAVAAASAELATLPPLAGVPLAVKDNMNLVGTRTTCASRMLENYESVYTATCVQRMLDAGCLPMGKANMDEFAFGSSTESSAFHRTNNPWDTERVPGGSSGGSAAAVAG